MQSLEQKVADTITSTVESMELELVQVKIHDGQKRKQVQILLDNPKTGRITIDECAKASQHISTLLDVEDIVQKEYDLEVSSPGIDRPLVKAADYERFLGFDAKIETQLPIQGRRRFKGRLTGLENNQVSIHIDGCDYVIPLSAIKEAKLILTDALIKAHQQQLAANA